MIVQKSVREGFGLTVTEALWKAKPVVASSVGGITVQIKHKHNGLLCHSVDGAALARQAIAPESDYARHLGENGRNTCGEFLADAPFKGLHGSFCLFITRRI